MPVVFLVFNIGYWGYIFSNWPARRGYTHIFYFPTYQRGLHTHLVYTPARTRKLHTSYTTKLLHTSSSSTYQRSFRHLPPITTHHQHSHKHHLRSTTHYYFLLTEPNVNLVQRSIRYIVTFRQMGADLRNAAPFISILCNPIAGWVLSWIQSHTWNTLACDCRGKKYCITNIPRDIENQNT